MLHVIAALVFENPGILHHGTFIHENKNDEYNDVFTLLTTISDHTILRTHLIYQTDATQDDLAFFILGAPDSIRSSWMSEVAMGFPTHAISMQMCR